MAGQGRRADSALGQRAIRLKAPQGAGCCMSQESVSHNNPEGQVVDPRLAKAQADFEAVRAALERSLIHGRYMVVDCFEEANVTSFVSTRLGGVSKAPYDSFNVALHVGDDPGQVVQNRLQMRSDFGLGQLCFMEQTHSNKVEIVTAQNRHQDTFDCDGLVTREIGVGLAVMTADCLPLLLCDQQERVIGAIHCGWRGLVHNIVENAVAAMESIGAKRRNIVAYMGPAIGPNSFEVGAEVRDAFVAQSPENVLCFRPEFCQDKAQHEEAIANLSAASMALGAMAFSHVADSQDEVCNLGQHLYSGIKKDEALASAVQSVAGKFWCDIFGLTVLALRRAATSNIVFGGRYDTYLQNSVFYSYRRAHQTGRNATVICLN